MTQILVDTLLRCSDLALIALGLSMVYGLVKFPNIATCNTPWWAPTLPMR